MTKHEVIRMIADLKKVDIAGAQELLDTLLEKAVAAEETADFNEFFKEEARSNPLFTRILDRRMEMLQQGETEETADDEADGEDEADEEAADEADDDADEDRNDDGTEELMHIPKLQPENRMDLTQEAYYPGRVEYLEAVLREIERCFLGEGISASREQWVRGISGFRFRRRIDQQEIDACVYVDMNSCSVGMEYTLPISADKSRALLVEHMMMQRNAAIHWGTFIREESTGAQKLVYGYSAEEVFSKKVFWRYLKSMDAAVEDYLHRMQQYSAGTLTPAQKDLIRKMMSDLRSVL